MAGAERIAWKTFKKAAKLNLGRVRYDASAPAVIRRDPVIPREPTIVVQSNSHIKVTSVRSGKLEEIHVSAVPHSPRNPARAQTTALYAEVLERLDDPRSLRIVVERVFGKLSAKDAFLSARADALKPTGMSPEGPITYIEGAPVEGNGLAGVHLTLVRGDSPDVRIQPIGEGENAAGFSVTTGDVCRAYLSAVHGLDPAAPGASSVAQARRMFDRADALLRAAGLTYSKVACTRIYLRRLLEWYNEFNGVRTPWYRKLGLMNGEKSSRIPASTGIQGKISDDCECFMDVLAVSKGPGDACPFTRLSSPLQNEATDYGSSFARGVCVDVPDVRYVLISGTAAIDENGRSVHPDDPVGQTRRTISNFEAILRAGGASLADLIHVVWYCKDPSHAKIIRRETKAGGWPQFPYPIVCAEVCRDELLVEVDGSAVFQTA